MEDSLFTNRNSRKDFIDDALRSLAEGGPDVYIATAFFTDASLIRYYVDNGCKVRLIIRLGFPTHPDALGELLKIDAVEARYFTHPSFHPKLYVFGTDVALVGSANLTNNALHANQEIMVSIDAADPRFDALATLFSEYWTDAKVLSQKVMQDYRQKFSSFANAAGATQLFDEEVKAQFGDVAAQNIVRGGRTVSKENSFIDSYEKRFQECVGAFAEVRLVYESVGKYKVTREQLPLRLEIDGFISWVREECAKGESWRHDPIASSAERKQRIMTHIEKWHNSRWDWFHDMIVPTSYPRLKKVFRDESALRAADDSTLFEALTSIHAFRETLRYHKGGMEALKRDFLTGNDSKQIRDSLGYLVFGRERTEIRMANLIFNSDYKLRYFGKSAVQELIGWLNGEEIPVVNGRTTKVLEYFGFQVQQTSEM